MDVTATILDAAGAKATRELDGKSLLPWMNNKALPVERLFGWRQRIINHRNEQNYLRAEACRFGNLKYVKTTQPKGRNPKDFRSLNTCLICRPTWASRTIWRRET